MKKGFTLAELLIVLGITGIIAAVLLPAINNLMPDKTKIMYLKAYDGLTESIKLLTTNTALYPAVLSESGENILINKYPLVNNSKPLKSPFNKDTYTGDSKLCNLLAFTMNAASNSCSTTNYPETPSYTTPNGMRWWIVQAERTINPETKTASYQTDIYVDVDPSKHSTNCLYDCKNPDTFKFLLAADGTIIPADPIGLKYIETRKTWLKKKYDVEGNILVNLDSSLKDFEYKNAEGNEAPPNCPEGYSWDGNACTPPSCGAGQVWNGNACVEETHTCASGYIWNGSACVASTPDCPDGQYWNGTACVERDIAYIDIHVKPLIIPYITSSGNLNSVAMYLYAEAAEPIYDDIFIETRVLKNGEWDGEIEDGAEIYTDREKTIAPDKNTVTDGGCQYFNIDTSNYTGSMMSGYSYDYEVNWLKDNDSNTFYNIVDHKPYILTKSEVTQFINLMNENSQYPQYSDKQKYFSVGWDK